MIYFSNNFIRFPRHFGNLSNIFTINLVNTVTHKKYELTMEDTSDLAGWYLFDFTNVELEYGTYRYNFNGEVGLLQVGNFIKEIIEYNNETEHKVYEG